MDGGGWGALNSFGRGIARETEGEHAISIPRRRVFIVMSLEDSKIFAQASSFALNWF